MSLLTKENAKQHCRTCLKKLSAGEASGSSAGGTNEISDNKDIPFNVNRDVELQQLLYMYVDGPYKSEIPCSVIQEFPQNVCLICYNKLHTFARFRKRAQQSAEKLRTVLNCSSGMIKVEIDYEEDESEPKIELLGHSDDENKLQFRDVLMEREGVFLDTSVATLADVELHDDPEDPFGPSESSITECNSKQCGGKEDTTEMKTPYECRKNKYKCTQCNQSYAFNSELEAHVRQVHEGTKLPFACDHCDKSYRYIRSLQEHMKTKHQAVVNANAQFKCKVCPKAFLTDLSLKKHMCYHIKEDMARVCGICNKRFPVKNLLVEHLRTHSTDGRIPCSQCDKSFLWYQDLLNHERSSHLKEKPFPCKLCDKSFQTQKSLRFHSYRHSGEKPYLCDVCGKDFRQPTAMKQHRIKHFKNDKSNKS